MSGTLPSQLGALTKLTRLRAYGSAFSGQVPTEFGNMTSMQDFRLQESSLTGALPTQLGQWSGLKTLYLWGNQLSGSLPTELSLPPNLQNLLLGDNQFSGSLPSQFGRLSALTKLYLNNNAFSSSIPPELELLAFNGSLRELKIEENPGITGVVPEELCSLGQGIYKPGLNLTCGEQLCGCCWCPCEPLDTTTVAVAKRSTDECPNFHPEEWPGAFPLAGSNNSIVVNGFSDSQGWEATIEWSRQKEGEEDAWELLDHRERALQASNLQSYTYLVEPGSLYKLRLLDALGNGICCIDRWHDDGVFGWISITNSTPSATHTNGTVMWDGLGDYGSWMQVLIKVDLYGNSEVVQVEFGAKEKFVMYPFV